MLQNAEWESVAIEFNAGTASVPRTAEILKAKFKNMKKDYRLHKGKARQSQYATGGGPATDMKPYLFEEDMGELLALSAEGLFNAHDGDRSVGNKEKDTDSEGMDDNLEQVRQIFYNNNSFSFYRCR